METEVQVQHKTGFEAGKTATEKHSVCVFVHFCKKNTIPRYVQIYLRELAGYFDEIILVTNERELNPLYVLPSGKISLRFEKNEGYDFGMFYKIFSSIQPKNYSKIALVNDSNILINKLDQIMDWGNSNHADFWGVIDSDEKPWFSSQENTYHIQSHFLVFNPKAIQKLSEFLNSLEISTIFDIKNQKKLRRRVIDQWEIGLSQYMIKEGMKVSSYFNSNDLCKKYKTTEKNVAFSLPVELASEGYPLLKKKIINQQPEKMVNQPPQWKDIIEKFSKKEWQMDLAINELVALKKTNFENLIINFVAILKKGYSAFSKN